MEWKLSDFNYDLPKEFIAQTPLKDRSSSKLMVLNRSDNTIEHKMFYDIVDLLDDKLKIVIEYRVKYPELSLLELSEIITRETGTKISKSGLNHRFRKIREIITNIENKE